MSAPQGTDRNREDYAECVRVGQRQTAVNAVSSGARTAVVERRQVTVESLVDRAFSMSSTSPGKLGERAATMAAALRAVLGAYAEDGLVTEIVAVWALVGRRPHEVTEA